MAERGPGQGAGLGRRPSRAVPLALLGWLAFVAYQSLAGGVAGECVLPLSQQGRRLSWSDGVANFAAYLPLGMLAAAWIGARPRLGGWRLGMALVAIAGFSLSMELIQACLEGRVSSWFDLAINSAGGLAGLLTMQIVFVARGGSRARAWPVGGAGTGLADARDRRSAMLWVVSFAVLAWLAMALSPWRFTFDVSTLRANLAFLRGYSSWIGPEPWALARHLCGWIAIGLAWRAVWPQRSAASFALMAVVGLSLVLQLLLARRALSLDELLAMAAAILLVGSLPGGAAERLLARLVPLFALASVCAYQLAPGRSGARATAFDWLPQIGRGGLLGALELSLMFGWLALSIVLGLRWLALRGGDVSRARIGWPLAAVAVLFATEVLQLWIPGRHPDVSPPLLTALGFVVGWALFGVPSQPRWGQRVPGGTSRRAAAALRGPATTRFRRSSS